ncbi:MAG: MerR family DNA-binding transcriptional regulator [Microgenomates group bacterium]
MDHTYTIQEVATKLNLSDKTLRRWEEAGRFRSSRTLGNQRRYSLEDIQILDAIKHGTINEQKDLLTIDQAAKLCGVSPSTLTRWEDSGKIHPMITSGNTYYPRQKLTEKMEELKQEYPEPVPSATPRIQAQPPIITPSPRPKISPPDIHPLVTNTLITILLLTLYHLIFSIRSTPISPRGQADGSVRGASTTLATDPRVDDLLTKFKDHVSAQMLKDAKPIIPTTIYLDNSSYITGTGVIGKGQDQASIVSDKIKAGTPITASFTSDYAPAKKYWVTAESGSFTLHTDFVLTSDATFSYSFIATNSAEVQASTPSAIIKP